MERFEHGSAAERDPQEDHAVIRKPIVSRQFILRPELSALTGFQIPETQEAIVANVHDYDNSREARVRALLNLVLAMHTEIKEWYELNEIKYKNKSDYDSMKRRITNINNLASQAKSQVPTFGLMGVPKINTLFVQFLAEMAKYEGTANVWGAHKVLREIEAELLNITL